MIIKFTLTPSKIVNQYSFRLRSARKCKPAKRNSLASNNVIVLVIICSNIKIIRFNSPCSCSLSVVGHRRGSSCRTCTKRMHVTFCNGINVECVVGGWARTSEEFAIFVVSITLHYNIYATFNLYSRETTRSEGQRQERRAYRS